MQDLIDLNEWFRHAITGLAQGAWIVWLRVVGELRVEAQDKHADMHGRINSVGGRGGGVDTLQVSLEVVCWRSVRRSTLSQWRPQPAEHRSWHTSYVVCVAPRLSALLVSLPTLSLARSFERSPLLSSSQFVA